jgi:predicted PurR-regulated permease PerM
MQRPLLTKIVLVLFLVVLSVAILYFAKPVLVPLALASVLAMLFMPFSRWLEKKGVSRTVAGLLCVFSFIVVVAGILWLLSWQLSNIMSDVTQIKQEFSQTFSKFQKTLKDHFGIPIAQQKKMLDQQSEQNGGLSKIVTAVAGSLFGVVVGIILTLVYMFLLLYYRDRLKNFILKLFPAGERAKTRKIIAQCSKVVQQYLTGLATIISLLWVMYGIGFSIVGIKSPLFFAILCGLLEVVPFVGNLTGSTLTVIMALSQGGGIVMALGVLATYFVVQSIQFYIISPIVLGSEVNINALFIIISLIAGELIWGVPGMVLAIPFLGMTKIIFDNVEVLKPFGYLIGHERSNRNRKAVLEKIKMWFSKKAAAK